MNGRAAGVGERSYAARAGRAALPRLRRPGLRFSLSVGVTPVTLQSAAPTPAQPAGGPHNRRRASPKESPE
jgi:hypothetical protein